MVKQASLVKGLQQQWFMTLRTEHKLCTLLVCPKNVFLCLSAFDQFLTEPMLEYWIYTSDLDNLHALNSRKIQISWGFLVDWFAVLPENLWPRCVSNSRRFTYVWCKYCKKEPIAMFAEYLRMYIYWRCTYLCMYIHKKRLFHKNRIVLKNLKLVTLLLNVCFDVRCHASKLDWSTVTLLSLVNVQDFFIS